MTMKMEDAFFVEHPKGEEWISLIGHPDVEAKYSKRMLVSSKQLLMEIVEGVNRKAYDPIILFMGIERQNTICFPILTVKSNLPL